MLFREYFSQQARLMKLLADNAYAAYLFHVPVVIALQYALRLWAVGPVVKFIAVGAAGTVLVFGLSHLLRKIPGVDRVL